jgi:Zn-dependent peptidase ImmA (M78 family)
LPSLKPIPGDLPHEEIAEALLDEAGGLDVLPTSEVSLLDYLGLKQMSFDFGGEPDFVQVAPDISSKLRAALSVNHRVVATHSQLGAKRSRWSVFHEIAHFVLPEHVERLFLDDDRTLSVWAHDRLEREANSFAAELIFHGNQFTEESLDLPLSCQTALTLAPRYDASFESAIRRYVERHALPCAAVVFERAQTISGEDLEDAKYRVHYTVASSPFKRKYFSGVQTDPELTRGSEILQVPGASQIGNVVATELSMKKGDGGTWTFKSELFTNGYKIFQFLIGDAK